ncbi:MAG: DUF4974 domain-containing protein [Bacteroidetes bacterium]|nr:DUF4974 domain-containing protein [Bacteroidota bacterium]
MQISEALIQKFFDGRCTSEEAKAVQAYFYANPESLEGYFNEEWKEQELSEAESSQLRHNITTHVWQDASRARRLWNWSIAAAAVTIGALLMLTIRIPDAKKTIEGQEAASAWMGASNTSSRNKTMYLLDGSMVELYPGAQIRYRPFDKSENRAVYLNGKAFFRVAQNASKPFIVYDRELETTVLGTQFTVQDTANKVVVALYDGKVSVKPTLPMQKWEKPVYLTPGQTLLFDRSIASFKITNPARRAVEKHETKDTLNTWMASNGTNWYMFNNQSLSTVFEQLEELYNIRIIYNQSDVNNVYFIGRFEKTDSVEEILNRIALLKKLHIRRQGKTFVITKSKH